MLDFEGITKLKRHITECGYPEIAMYNLLKSLGIDTDRFNMSTDAHGESAMPAALAEIVQAYTARAHVVKGLSGQAIKTSGPFLAEYCFLDAPPKTKSAAKAALKSHYRNLVTEQGFGNGDEAQNES